MTAHSPQAAILANITLFIHLIKLLGEKGVISDNDWTGLLNSAASELSTHAQGQEALAVIEEVTKAKFVGM